MDDAFGVAAGWYPDPLGLPQLRWWDSQAWTEHTSDARAPIVLQPTTILGFADDDEDEQRTPTREEEEFPSRREQRARERRENGDLLQAPLDMEIESGSDLKADLDIGLDVDEERNELSAQPLLAMTLRELEPPLTDTVDDATPGPRRASTHTNALPMESLFSALSDVRLVEDEAPVRTLKKVKTYTAVVWAIALMPLFQVAISILLVTGLGLGANWPLMIAVVALPYFIVLGFAFYDRLDLQVRGHTKPASGLWALLTAPVYLIMRAVRTYRQTGKGFAPAALFASASVSVFAGILVVPGILLAVVPGPFAAEAAQSVRSTAMSLGGDITLVCPTPPLAIGDTFACLATKPSGATESISVSLERENGWIAWRVRDWGSWTLAD